jgi:hypothetical protein
MSSVGGRGVPTAVERIAATHAGVAGDGERALRWYRRRRAQRILRLAARLTQMGPVEVAHRLGRLARKTVQARGPSSALNRSAERVRATFLARVSPLGVDGLGRLLRERFLFGPQDAADLIATLRVAQRDRCLDTARRLCAEGVTLLGWHHGLEPGALSWCRDPETGATWPNTALDEEHLAGGPADVKYVWELNRHQFLAPLGRAYSLSGDACYVQRAAALVDDWITTNPVGVGVNWASTLEVGLRAIAWLWALPHVVAWPGASPHGLARWLGSVADHYHFLCRNLSVYTDPTNHLVGEATALWMLSTCFPMLPGSERQARRALAILAHEAGRQVAPDGINREQAFGYERFVLELLLQVVALLRRRGEEIPPILAQRVVATLDACAAFADADGGLPPVGDGDGGRALPFVDPLLPNTADLLAAGAVLFDRADWKAIARSFGEPPLWLLGTTAQRRFAELAIRTVPAASRVFADGGYCLFKAAGDQGELRLVFDVGALGLWPNAAHGHADALSVIVSVGGTRLLDDPGTGTYRNAQVRNSLRSTAAHNTVQVDGLDQADAFDVFKWINPPTVRLHAHYVGSHFDYALASHTGYARLRQPIWHTRALLFVRPDGWLIVDRLEGRGEHTFARHFNCPPTAVVVRRGAAAVSVRDPDRGRGLDLVFGGAAADLRLTHDGLWSGGYGLWEPAPRLCLTTHGQPPLTFFTLITPQGGDTVFSAAVRDETTCGGGRRPATVWRYGSSLVLSNPGRLPVELPHGLESDAELLFVRVSERDGIERAFVGGGGYLRSGAETVLTCAAGCAGAELVA